MKNTEKAADFWIAIVVIGHVGNGDSLFRL